MQFSQVRLLVNNFDACFRFYRNVLGLEVGFGKEGDVYADFRTTDNTSLALFGRADMAAAIGGSAPTATAAQVDTALIVFGVDNVDATVEQLKARNIEFVTNPTDRPEWGMRTAHLRDPDGNLVELFHSLAMSEGSA